MRTLIVSAMALSWMVATLCLVTPAWAEGEMCTEPQELDKYRLLRRMSLDLRQQLPSYGEYGLLEDEEEVLGGPSDSISDASVSADATAG